MSGNSWENGEGGSQRVDGRPLLCAVFVGCSLGLDTSGTCLDLLLTWLLVVPAARIEQGCGAGLSHSPTTGARRAEGWGWGWAGGQEMLGLMPRDSLGSKKIPWLGGWKRWHKGGSVCVSSNAHPPSQQQEEPLGCLEDTNISAEGSGRAKQTHGGCSLLGWVSQPWGSDPLGWAACLQGALSSPESREQEMLGSGDTLC